MRAICTCVTATLLAGCGGEDVDHILALDGDPENGAAVYSSTCGTSACHGSTGTNGPAPDLREHLDHHDDEDVASVIVGGSGDMPAQNLSDQDVADVLAYMRQEIR